MKRLIRIESSAGGGKTSRLTQRYIELLKNEINFNRILAITFTNKASQEMKRRILRKLKEMALNGDKFAMEILDGKSGIIENFSDFSIKTIDSFLNSLLKSCALDLKIPPEPEFVDPASVLDEALEILIAEAERDNDTRKNLLDLLNSLFITSSSFDPYFSLRRYINSLLFLETQVIKSNCSFEIRESLRKIFEKVKLKINEIKEREGFLFLSDIQSLIFKYVHENDIPYLYYKLGEKFYHFLIDEFQDTSLVQWESLKPLIHNALAGLDPEGNKGTFFYVGDPKQSIYRWRGSRWELFNEVDSEFPVLSSEEKELEYTDINYRSVPEIVNFVCNLFKEENFKKFFHEIFKGKRDYTLYIKEITEVYKNVKQKASEEKMREKGYIEIKIMEDKEKDIEGEIFSYLDSIIEDTVIKRHRNYGDIAILERKNEDARKIATYLLSKGLPVYASYEISMENLPLIKTVLYFFKLMLNEKDHFSLYNLLQSEFFAKITGIKKEKINEFLFSEQRDFEKFKNEFPEFYEIYKYFKELSRIYSPYYLLLEFDRVFKLGERFKKEYLQFLGLLKGVCREGENLSLYDFVKKFEKNPYIFSPSGKDAINVITIHQAKGLQFKIVISLFAPMKDFMRPIGSKEEFFLYDEDEQNPKVLPLKNEGYERMYYDVKHITQELNLLYVLLTRAEEELYVVINPSVRKSYSTFIYKSLENEFTDGFIRMGEKKFFEERDGNKNMDKKMEIKWERHEPLSVSSLSRNLFIKTESEAELLSHQEAERGEWIHLVLSKIKNLNDRNFEKIIEKSIYIAKCEWSFYKSLQKDFIKDTGYFRNKLQKDFIKDFFFHDKRVETEFEIVDRRGNTFRIDRIIFDDPLKIVEFKTGTEKEQGHFEQLKNYISVVNEIFKKPVKGYLVYLDSEEVYEL